MTDQPQLTVFWPVWREWTALPVQDMDPEDDGDMVLFECSLSLSEPDTWDCNPSPPSFTVAFTRQFTHEGADGEYLSMEQLGAGFVYEPLQVFRDITTISSFSAEFGTADSIWGVPGARAAKWADRVEGTESHRTALDQTPRRFAVSQGTV